MPQDLSPVRVGALAGGRYPEDPRWVELDDGVRFVIEAVEDRRREPERLVYRVRLKDGRRMVLYYTFADDTWLGTEVRPSTA